MISMVMIGSAMDRARGHDASTVSIFFMLERPCLGDELRARCGALHAFRGAFVACFDGGIDRSSAFAWLDVHGFIVAGGARGEVSAEGFQSGRGIGFLHRRGGFLQSSDFSSLQAGLVYFHRSVAAFSGDGVCGDQFGFGGSGAILGEIGAVESRADRRMDGLERADHGDVRHDRDVDARSGVWT